MISIRSEAPGLVWLLILMTARPLATPTFAALPLISMALATISDRRFLDAALAPAYDVVLGAHVDIDGLIIHVDTNDVIAVPTIGFLCTQMCTCREKSYLASGSCFA